MLQFTIELNSPLWYAFFDFLRQVVREVQTMLRMPNSSTRDKRNQPTQEKIILRFMRQSLKKKNLPVEPAFFENKNLAAEPAFFENLP